MPLQHAGEEGEGKGKEGGGRGLFRDLSRVYWLQLSQRACAAHLTISQALIQHHGLYQRITQAPASTQPLLLAEQALGKRDKQMADGTYM